MSYKAFNLRNKEEAPLIVIDSPLKIYSDSIGAQIIFNYRDYPSRTIFKRKGRLVKYLQIKLDHSTSEMSSGNLAYNVYFCEYKIKFPFLWFWNMYFDIESKKCKKVGIIKDPIEFNKFLKLVEGVW